MEYIQINQKKATKITTKFAILWKEKGLFFKHWDEPTLS